MLRLLLPVSDKQRGAYGIKEAALGKLYVKILCLAKDSPDAQKLLNFRHVIYYDYNYKCPNYTKMLINSPLK